MLLRKIVTFNTIFGKPITLPSIPIRKLCVDDPWYLKVNHVLNAGIVLGFCIVHPGTCVSGNIGVSDSRWCSFVRKKLSAMARNEALGSQDTNKLLSKAFSVIFLLKMYDFCINANPGISFIVSWINEIRTCCYMSAAKKSTRSMYYYRSAW